MATSQQYYTQWNVSALCFLVLVAFIEAIDPSTTTGCFIHTAMKHMAEKDGCRSHEFFVRGCWGRCDTSEVPQLMPPYVKAKHPVCTYATYDVMTVVLPDCDPEVDPTYTYLSALSCGCQVMLARKTEYSYRPDFYLQTAEQ
uniref:Glycoprotein hormone beta-5.1 n=1 Tax=Ophionotus victoriae TaxID=667017 RepID=A0A220W0D8_9ECHI|nr:glycoprotein hormone beta-5.1 precursor [Ophionotus victoriae]